MKSSILMGIVLLANYPVFSQTTGNEILGKWMSADKGVAIEVTKSGNIFKATVIWFDERRGSGTPMMTRHDTHNPNPALRTRKVIGMSVLSGLHYNPKDKQWQTGTIYDASSGRYWSAQVSMINYNSMDVRGYWKFTWIGKSLVFNRMK